MFSSSALSTASLSLKEKQRRRTCCDLKTDFVVVFEKKSGNLFSNLVGRAFDREFPLPSFRLICPVHQTTLKVRGGSSALNSLPMQKMGGECTLPID